jgi:uncharacterized protein YndB with AHSA1/START domain
VAGDPSALTLHLEKRLDATPTTAFAAFVDPAQLVEWWGPTGFTSPSIQLDARVGGTYRIAMLPPDGELFYLRGEFREVDPPRRLVYTFVWEDPDPDDRETLVMLSFGATTDGTTVVLEQAPFATSDRYELHRSGWTEAFVRLEQSLSHVR